MSAAGFRAFLADLEIRNQQEREASAVGWVVVTIDNEFEKVVHVTGLFDTPEAALLEAGRRDAQDKRFELAESGEAGWTHAVAPLFAPDEERSS